MPKMSRKKSQRGKTTNFGLNTMPPEEFLAGIRRMQTKRGRKEFYAPIDPTIYPAEYEKSCFTMKDIDALAQTVPDFPSGKIEIQICDQEQHLTRKKMDRRQAFMQLLNQAVWRYKYFKETDFVKPEAFLKKSEKIRDVVEELQTLLNPNLQDDAGRFVIARLEQCEAPLAQARISIRKVGMLCQRVDLLVQYILRIGAPASKKPRNQGDTLFPGFIDDLLIIWIVIFERDVGTSSKKNEHTGKNERTGPLIRFVRAVLAKADIKKSDDTIVKASRSWKRRYGESYKSEKFK
jgi:hypothetical protein